MSTRTSALNAYRHALRATKIAFDGDAKVLTAARSQIKNGFYNPDETKSVEERIKHLNGISTFLLNNIVQGKKDDSGKYRLNIHEHTELGDNESIFKAKKTLQAQGGGCCGGGAALAQ